MRWRSSDLLAAVAVAAGVLAIAVERQPLAACHRQITSTSDVYALPPAREMVTLSFGYRSAAADLIFGHVLVAAGIHTAEKRWFEHASRYLDAINELDPKFPAPYRFADTLLTLQTVEVPESSVRDARRILLRGTRELPYDQRLWSSAGQFLAYLAPGRLHDPAEQTQFRQEGARLLARACELVSAEEEAPHYCLSAAGLLSAGGNVSALRAFLERALLVTDDPAQRAVVEAKLRELAGADAQQELAARTSRFAQLWRADLPFLSRAAMAALGPGFDPARCAGKLGLPPGDPCTTTFRDRLASP